MSFLPKSPKARRRLTLIAAIAPVLILAIGLALWGFRGSISLFYTPSEADACHSARSSKRSSTAVPGDCAADGPAATNARHEKTTMQTPLATSRRRIVMPSRFRP